MHVSIAGAPTPATYMADGLTMAVVMAPMSSIQCTTCGVPLPQRPRSPRPRSRSMALDRCKIYAKCEYRDSGAPVQLATRCAKALAYPRSHLHLFSSSPPLLHIPWLQATCVEPICLQWLPLLASLWTIIINNIPS